MEAIRAEVRTPYHDARLRCGFWILCGSVRGQTVSILHTPQVHVAVLGALASRLQATHGIPAA